MDITNVIEAIEVVSENSDQLIDVIAVATTGGEHFIKMGAFIGAGLALVGASGVGAGQGYAAGAAALAVSRNPEAKPAIMSAMLIGMAIAESAAIYALLVAILLIFVAPTI